MGTDFFIIRLTKINDLFQIFFEYCGIRSVIKLSFSYRILY